MTKNVPVRLVSLLALVVALALSAGPARADSQTAAVTRELERARSLASHGDQRNACKSYSRASELAHWYPRRAYICGVSSRLTPAAMNTIPR